jgi:hypothetical protein
MTRETEFKGNNRGAPDLNLNTEISSTKDDGTEYAHKLEAPRWKTLLISHPRAKENLLSLIRTFGADVTHYYPAICEAADAGEAAMRCIAANRVLKGNSVEIFKAYGKEALDRYEQFWPFFQGMLHRLESTGEVRQCARVFQICCQNSLIEKFGDHLLKVADSKELAPEV